MIYVAKKSHYLGTTVIREGDEVQLLTQPPFLNNAHRVKILKVSGREAIRHIAIERFNRFYTIKPVKESKEMTKKINEKFYMIIRDPKETRLDTDGFGNPRIASNVAGPRSIYNSYERAKEAAEACASKYGYKFIILEAVESFEIKKPVVSKRIF